MPKPGDSFKQAEHVEEVQLGSSHNFSVSWDGSIYYYKDSSNPSIIRYNIEPVVRAITNEATASARMARSISITENRSFATDLSQFLPNNALQPNHRPINFGPIDLTNKS